MKVKIGAKRKILDIPCGKADFVGVPVDFSHLGSEFPSSKYKWNVLLVPPILDQKAKRKHVKYLGSMIG